jgi:hypothetical protein
MGNPSPRPLASSPLAGGGAGPSFAQLSTQHERLILELLPFKDSAKFHDWLTSPPLRGCWSEFCRDYLSHNAHAPEPDKVRTAQAAKDAFSGRKEKYMVYHPDKNGWTAEDHHVRFIVQVVSDGLMKGMWSEGEWKKRGIEISKAGYEVLSFLRSTMVLGELPPRYSA